jgi:tetratricopeptide (TPR) repeat protein
MGELLEYESPQEALDWLRRGLSQLPDKSPEEEAALHIHIGTANMNLGNYTEAQDALNRGLALLSGGPSQLRSTTLMNLGAVQFFQGRIQPATECALQGLEISRQLHDHFQGASILSNLGAYRFAAGDWHGALADFQEALTLAERLGSKTIRATAEGNLGVAYTNLGDEQSALKHLAASLELARQSGLRLFEGIAQFHLADLYVRAGQWDSASLSLNEAERLALETGARANLPEIYSTRAEMELVLGRLPAALDWAEQSVNLASELGVDTELGIGFRVLGQVQSANGRFQEAVAAFERSRLLLDGRDRYEAARTNLHWGVALISNDEAEERSISCGWPNRHLQTWAPNATSRPRLDPAVVSSHLSPCGWRLNHLLEEAMKRASAVGVIVSLVVAMLALLGADCRARWFQLDTSFFEEQRTCTDGTYFGLADTLSAVTWWPDSGLPSWHPGL